MAREIGSQTVIVASRDQLSADLGDSAALLNVREGVYYGLDEVGSRVWQSIQQPRSLASITDELLQEYEVERERLEADLISLAADLCAAGLAEVAP